MKLEQISFLASGLLFWWPVIQPGWTARHRPEWPILLYLFLATCAVRYSVRISCLLRPRGVSDVLLIAPPSAGFSALADQEYAGALMWTWVTVVYLIAGDIIHGTITLARELAPVCGLKSGFAT